MDGVVAYILGKSYVKKSLIGIGALAGAPCQVQSINKAGKTTTITLKWEDNVGGVHTQSFDVEDGADGVSVVGATIDANGHLILTLSDTNTIDCGKVLPQYDTMPIPSASNNGQVLQYIGATNVNYTKNYFYECVESPVGSGTYIWKNVNVQDSYTKIEIGDLTNLPDNTKNVVENITQLKLEINQLNGSLAKKEDIFRYNIIPPATSDIVGAIIQYIGATDANYTNGYSYQCIESPVGSGTYTWVQKNLQPSGGGTGGDGVVDGYYNDTDHLFYEEAGYINPISGDDNTIYVSLDTNLLYRYNGLIFIRVDENSSGEDDVIDGYYNPADHKFYEESTYVTEITGETGKIYISDDTNIQYRWDGTKFVTISSSIEVDDELSTTSENPVQNKVLTQKIDDIELLLGSKVDKETGKGLSTNDFTNEYKDKVVALKPIYLIGSGLALDDSDPTSPNYGKLTATGMSIPIDDYLSASSVNPVQNQVITRKINELDASKLSLADVDNALSSSSVRPVQNQVITLAIEQLQGSALKKMQKMIGAQEDNFAIIDNDGGVKDSGISKDIVPASASVSNKLLVASNLSAGNGIDITGTTISVDINDLTASKLGFIPASEKGSNGGVAELDNAGKVPSGQLPSYVDDVIEGYLDSGNFYEDAGHTQLIAPESSKIYINLDDNTTYRWGGTAYVQISSSLALGTTHSTAFYGDHGQAAYTHSQITNGSNPHNTTANNINLNVPIPALSGSKLDVESTLYGVNTALGTKADKVTSAVSGHLAGLDGNGNLTDSGVIASNVIEKVTTATGLLKDDGSVDTTTYAPSNKAYLTDDAAETTLDDTDYIPFYDTSETAKRKSLWSNIKSVLKTYFDEIYATIANLADKISWTDADKYVSKNLLDVPAYQTINGFTYLSDENKYVRCLNGSDTRSWSYALSNVYMTLGAGKYNVRLFAKTAYTTGYIGFAIFDSSDNYLINRTNQAGFDYMVSTGSSFTLNAETDISIIYKVGDGEYAIQITKDGIPILPYAPYIPNNTELVSYKFNSVTGAHNFNADLKSKALIRGTGTGTTAPDRVYGFKVGISVKANEQYKVAFDIKDSANFATSNGIGFRFATRSSGSTVISNDISLGHDNGHYSGILTITADSDSVYLYVYMLQSETDPTATLTIDNLVVCLPSDIDDYTEYAMTNYQLTQAASVIPAPSSSNTETTVVQAITGASNTTANPPSAYAMQQWSNTDRKRLIYEITANPSGTTGIGTWDSSATPVETDWWQDDAFKLPDSANSKNVDLEFRFDPQYNNGEIVAIGGYILDTTTGKLCIKFAKKLYNAQLIAVDINYTRNNYPT